MYLHLDCKHAGVAPELVLGAERTVVEVADGGHHAETPGGDVGAPLRGRDERLKDLVVGDLSVPLAQQGSSVEETTHGGELRRNEAIGNAVAADGSSCHHHTTLDNR